MGFREEMGLVMVSVPFSSNRCKRQQATVLGVKLMHRYACATDFEYLAWVDLGRNRSDTKVLG